MKRLVLVHPDSDGVREFTDELGSGTEISRDAGGYWVVKGNTRRWFPDARVAEYVETDYQGLLPEPSASDTARYGERTGSGWTCAVCGRELATLHALKIHHGIKHP